MAKKDTDGLNMPVFKTLIRNILHCIRPRLINLKYYSKCRFKHCKNKNVFYFVFEPNKKHPGIADRVKAIMSCYDLAKSNGYQLKVYFETPFRLYDYLKPKKNWVVASLDELEYSVYDTKIVDEYYRDKPVILEKDKQYHCYNYAGHHMPYSFPTTGYKFYDLFNELFEFSNEIKNEYRRLGIIEGNYVSCHLRFVNALEKFENTFFENHIDKEEDRQELIKRCKTGIEKIVFEKKDKEVYVFSDSKVFLECLSDLPVKTLDSSNIGHVSEGNKSDSTFKSFLDLYVMSKGIAIYRFNAPELYSISHYALLAARIGNIEFKDIKV